MNLFLNPTGYRIGYTRYWFDSWYTHRINYPVFVHKSLEMKLLLEFTLRRRRYIKANWVYSHITYYTNNDKFYINVFIYDTISFSTYHRLAKKLRWRWYGNLRFVSRFAKRYLLDQQYYFQRWWYICQVLNFNIEALMLDDIKWRLPKKKNKKNRRIKT